MKMEVSNREHGVSNFEHWQMYMKPVRFFPYNYANADKWCENVLLMWLYIMCCSIHMTLTGTTLVLLSYLKGNKFLSDN